MPSPTFRPAAAVLALAMASLVGGTTLGNVPAGAATPTGGAPAAAAPGITCIGPSAGPGPAVDSFWLATTSGAVYAFNDAMNLHGAGVFSGTLADVVPDHVAGAFVGSLAAAEGYWLVSTAGKVVARGIAATYPAAVPGSVPATPVSDLTPVPGAKGYWLVSANGDVTAYGAARSYGAGHDPASGPGHVIRLVSTPDGKGYWLLSAEIGRAHV